MPTKRGTRLGIEYVILSFQSQSRISVNSAVHWGIMFIYFTEMYP